jgi:DNA-binding response OmpR family regulator
MIPLQEILKGKVLIIDDEPANVMILEETLKQRGFGSIKCVTDSREALESYKSFEPDLVLLDLNMPHFNGFQVIEQLTTVAPKNYVPIMMLTAQIDQGTRLRALDAGARDFLTKPFDILEVSLRIQNMLEVSLIYRQSRETSNTLNEKYEKAVFELAATKLKLQKEINCREELEAKLQSS